MLWSQVLQIFDRVLNANGEKIMVFSFYIMVSYENIIFVVKQKIKILQNKNGKFLRENERPQ